MTKRTLPVLCMLVGLGSCFSFAEPESNTSPFDRYLAGLKSHHPEAHLVRFAGECDVDIGAVAPRYAQSPSDKWVVVKDLSNALKDQKTDFYATVAVWHAADKILVEQWGMELDTGTYSRIFMCLRDSKIRFFEGVDWNIPVEGASPANPAWGYQQRWRTGASGQYEKVWSRFVDTDERPMKAPHLDAETKRDLDWRWTVHTWRDLQFPDALRR